MPLRTDLQEPSPDEIIELLAARVAELEDILRRAKDSVEKHDFFTTYDILHETKTTAE